MENIFLRNFNKIIDNNNVITKISENKKILSEIYYYQNIP
jgi:hypothetical protein